MTAYRKFLEKEYNEIYANMISSLLEVYGDGILFGDNAAMRLRIQQMEFFMRDKQFKLSNEIKTKYEDFFFERQALNPVVSTIQGFEIQESLINVKSLDPIIKERFRLLNSQFKGFMRDYKTDIIEISKLNSLLEVQEDGEFFRIGRRIKDDIREIGIKNITDKWKTGQAWTKTERRIFNDIKDLARKDSLLVSDLPINQRFEVKAFENLDNPDNFYFKLRTKDGKLRWYNTKDYSNLVAISTEREASWQGEIEESKRVGNYLVAYTFRGHDYLEVHDPCYRIDGQIFSTKKGYVASNGKIYPYIWDGLPTRQYLLPHPHCLHNLRGIIDNPKVLERFDKIAEGNPDGLKPKAA
jgi:hypothetical protein